MERREKICLHCANYIPETAALEGECKVDEDINSEEFCASYTKQGGDDGK